MTRRTLLTTLAAPAFVRAQSRPSRPNLLMLMADQHRGDCLGAAGNRAAYTPNLDRLAREGVLFRNGYSSTPTCTPARACLLTGQSPWNHGMLGYSRVAERYPYQMPEALAEAGYYTFGIGKMHYHPQRNRHGFHQTLLDESGRAESPDFLSDYRSWFRSQAPLLNPDATGIGWNDYDAKPYVLPERLHPTVWTADCAARFLEGYDRPEPFFLKVSFARPHSPYDPPQRWWDRFRDAGLPPAAAGKWAARYQPRSSDRTDIWHGDLGPGQVRKSRQGYFGSVSFIDEHIGRILEALEKRGLLEQTLILYFSDHGDMTGDHHLWRKSYAYEASAKIPFLMRWPEGMVSEPRGRTLGHPVELRDVFATFLDAAGREPARPIDGRSLLGPARGRGGWREWIDLEHDVCYSETNHWNALTDGKTKYIFHARDGEEQLFDLTRDPHELADLAGSSGHGAILRLWRERMIGHLSPRGEKWVKGGQLALRPRSQKHSPNYPQAET